MCSVFSAYCGGLWLCTLRMFVESAKILDKKEDLEKYTNILNKAKESYEVKLWNGRLFQFSKPTYPNAV